MRHVYGAEAQLPGALQQATPVLLSPPWKQRSAGTIFVRMALCITMSSRQSALHGQSRADDRTQAVTWARPCLKALLAANSEPIGHPMRIFANPVDLEGRLWYICRVGSTPHLAAIYGEKPASAWPEKHKSRCVCLDTYVHIQGKLSCLFFDCNTQCS